MQLFANIPVYSVFAVAAFPKSLSLLFLFSKFIFQMPIQQKAQTTKAFELPETTLEESYHPYERWSSLFVGFSDLFHVKTVCQVFLSFFFLNYISVVFMNPEEQL